MKVIHVPFQYYPEAHGGTENYVEALSRELSIRFGGNQTEPIDTLYFGGGTPSRLGGAGGRPRGAPEGPVLVAVPKTTASADLAA